jgi:hypothetical protein
MQNQQKDAFSEYAGGEIVADFNVVKESDKEVVDKEKLQKMIAERAYCKAEKRGFVSGHEIEDWLEAESEIKNQYFYWFQDVE